MPTERRGTSDDRRHSEFHIKPLAGTSPTERVAFRREDDGPLATTYLSTAVSTFAERIEAEGAGRFLDSIVVSHGFATYGRDYDVVILTVASLPPDVPIGDSTGTYVDARFLFRFTYCPEAHVTSSVSDDSWRVSWADVFTSYEEWEAHGNPDGFVWGTDRADAYPGLSYVSDSARAASWTERLEHEMHEVLIETNVFDLSLVCHDLRIYKVAVGDPRTHTLADLEEPELVASAGD